MTAELRAPYRIAIWGLGSIGSAVVQEAVALPELEVVGALVYSAAKDGADIGALAGVEPLGVTATRSVDEFLALECDVVLHTSLDVPGAAPLGDYVTLLEAGKNVITSHPYTNLGSRGPGFGAALEAAAERGGGTFHAAGSNPNFMCPRLVLALSGGSNDIKSITVEEYFDCVHQKDPGTLEVLGLGGDPDEVSSQDSRAVWYQKQYWYQAIELMAERMGVALDRIETISDCVAAPENLVTPVMTVKRGRVGRVGYDTIAYAGGGEPFITMRVGWYLTPIMKPDVVTSTTAEWIVTIDGRPATRTVVQRTTAGRGTGVVLVQAIPAVVDAPAGILETSLPAAHWKRDLRHGAIR